LSLIDNNCVNVDETLTNSLATGNPMKTILTRHGNGLANTPGSKTFLRECKNSLIMTVISVSSADLNM